jgi:hypothetical protein
VWRLLVWRLLVWRLGLAERWLLWDRLAGEPRLAPDRDAALERSGLRLAPDRDAALERSGLRLAPDRDAALERSGLRLAPDRDAALERSGLRLAPDRDAALRPAAGARGALLRETLVDGPLVRGVARVGAGPAREGPAREGPAARGPELREPPERALDADPPERPRALLPERPRLPASAAGAARGASPSRVAASAAPPSANARTTEEASENVMSCLRVQTAGVSWGARSLSARLRRRVARVIQAQGASSPGKCRALVL